MKEAVVALIDNLRANKTSFSEVLAFIDSHYQHQPTAFQNGEVYNTSIQNQGSARVFAFAALQELNEENTLQLFAEHYQSVLAHPEGMDHQNIRQFMRNGWAGIAFEGEALAAK